MKKSEMIQRLSKFLEETKSLGVLENLGSTYAAETLLKILEHEGMLPPAECLNPKKQAGRSLPFYSNEWEREDEEK